MSEENKKINDESSKSSSTKKNPNDDNDNKESNNDNDNIESGKNYQIVPYGHNLKLENETIVRSVFTKGKSKKNVFDPKKSIEKNIDENRLIDLSNSGKSYTILNRPEQNKKNDPSQSNILKKTEKILNFNITIADNDLFVRSSSLL